MKGTPLSFTAVRVFGRAQYLPAFLVFKSFGILCVSLCMLCTWMFHDPSLQSQSTPTRNKYHRQVYEVMKSSIAVKISLVFSLTGVMEEIPHHLTWNHVNTEIFTISTGAGFFHQQDFVAWGKLTSWLWENVPRTKNFLRGSDKPLVNKAGY